MAKKIYLKNENYIPNEDILIGIVSDNPSHKVCYQISKILNKNFIINLNYKKDRTLKPEVKKDRPSKTVMFEAFRWKSETKEKTIFIIPNKQEIEVSKKEHPQPLLYKNTPDLLVKKIILLPTWKHIDYIMRFEGFEHDEILEMAEKIKAAKKFQLITVSQTPKVENAVTLYFFD